LPWRSADIIVTTPEKWDGVSRSWRTRDYVRSVSLVCVASQRPVPLCTGAKGAPDSPFVDTLARAQVIFDEIHMLGQDRGPTLEVIVSRMNYMAAHLKTPVRLVGLSTALANAHDVAAWLGVEKVRVSRVPRPCVTNASGLSANTHICACSCCFVLSTACLISGRQCAPCRWRCTFAALPASTTAPAWRP